MPNLINCIPAALVTAAVAFVTCAPIATADDPTPCDSNDKQCQDQNQKDGGSGPVKKIAGEVEKGIDDANQANRPPDSNKNKPTQGLFMLINGVPTCLPVGQPAPVGARVEVVPNGPVDGRCTP
jgi:hypothetical protein